MCGKCSIKLFLVLLFLFCGCYKTGFHNLDPIEQQEYIINFEYTIPRFNNQPFSIKGALNKSGFTTL